MWAQCLNSSRVTRVNKVSWARDPFQICRSIDYWQAVAARDILTSSVGVTLTPRSPGEAGLRSARPSPEDF